MFSYLRTKEEFLHDCERIRYKIVAQEDEKRTRYVPVKTSLDETGSYCKVRGCNNDCTCSACSSGCNLYDRKRDYSDCKECNNISEMVCWLIKSVQYANWGKDVGIGEIHAWCQSVGVYMHDIVRNIEADSIAVGLEYFLENNAAGGTRSRADMLLAGYGKDGKKTIVIIELKQNDNKVFEANTAHNAAEELSAYVKSVSEASKNNEIDIIPYIYFHNMKPYPDGSGKEQYTPGKDRVDGIEIKIFWKNPENEIQAEINKVFDSSISEDPIEIMKELRNGYPSLTSKELAEIIYDGRKLGESEKLLRPDQRFAYTKIKNCIDGNDNGKICLVQGGPGSGKTLLVSLIIRYCINNNKKVLFLYHGTAPRNVIFRNKIKNLIKDDLKKLYHDDDKCERVLGFLDGGLSYSFFSTTPTSGKLDDLSDEEKYKEWIDGLNENDDIQKRIKNYKDYVGFCHYSYFRMGGVKDFKPDVVVFDEFHRYQGYKYQPPDKSKELLLDICKLGDKTILLYDPRQSIEECDIGCACIERLVGSTFDIQKYKMWSQFRCNKEEGFVTWIEQVLQIPSSSQELFLAVQREFDDKIYLDDLDIEVYLEDEIEIDKYKGEDEYLILSQEENKDKLKRIIGLEQVTTSDCRYNGLVDPIGDGGITVYKATYVQGIEVPNVLVVIDDSLDYKNGEVCFTSDYMKKYGSYPYCNGSKKAERELELKKNCYRVLLTRGLKKIHIYCENEGLRSHLKAYAERKAF